MQNPTETAQEVQEVQPEINNTNPIVEEIANTPEPETNLIDELVEAKDKYLRLYAEFENFRRRTAKEKIDLIKNAGEDIIKAMLPIVDDFDRAQKAFDKSSEVAALKEGVSLIQNKLLHTLEQKGLKVMESTIGKTFDVNEHESITNVPAPSDDMRGKVLDETERGYYLNEKILRFAKVVVGS